MYVVKIILIIQNPVDVSVKERSGGELVNQKLLNRKTLSKEKNYAC